MSSKKVRIGIIGVDPDRGWASYAHIPAIRSFDGFEITALSNRSKATAVKAGEKLNIAHTFDDNLELVKSPEVDLVVITVKVPYHKELVIAALEAGKHVYCEWPLGNGLEEAIEMEALGKKKNVQAFVGLQSQSVPAIRYIKHLIESGYVGKVLSTSVIASGLMLKTDEANAYTLDNKNGANILTIPFGASMHALCYCLGELQELNATTATVNKFGIVVETGRKVPVTIADQIAVTGVLESGAIASIHYRGGDSKGTNFLWEINGTEGDLVITADGGHVAFFPLTIKGAKKEQDQLEVFTTIPEEFTWVGENAPEGPPFNLAQNYALLLKDMQEGTTLAPRFSDAVIRHKLLHAIEQSAKTGERQRYN